MEEMDARKWWSIDVPDLMKKNAIGLPTPKK